ncbi:hypothetical protein [uncultured Winogradskyella sp.]|uniref:arsenate reductase family protein n=1 Tax=uncultured Winogradskyella sp. TaxID=395353 RepID=UPI0026366661|nr:hypothetical protein [uncultured Winogradskyella sp.]
MGILAKHNRQLIYIYSEDSILGNNMLPYVKSMDKAVRLININKENLSDTIWIELAAILNIQIKQLFNKDLIPTKEKNKIGDYSNSDWLKIISNSPHILQKPIAINGSKAKIIEQKSDIFPFYNNQLNEAINEEHKVIDITNHRDSTKSRVN